MLPSKVKTEVKVEVDVEEDPEQIAEDSDGGYERFHRSPGPGQRTVEVSGADFQSASSYYPNPSFSPPRRGDNDPLNLDLYRDPPSRYYFDDPRIRAPQPQPHPPKMIRRDLEQFYYGGAPVPGYCSGYGQLGGGGGGRGQGSLAFGAPLWNRGGRGQGSLAFGAPLWNRGGHYPSQSQGSFRFGVLIPDGGRGHYLNESQGSFSGGAPIPNRELSQYMDQGRGQGPSSYGFGATISNPGRGRAQPLSESGGQGPFAISNRGRGRGQSSGSSGDFFSEFRVSDDEADAVPKKDDWVQPDGEEAWAAFQESLQEGTMKEGIASPEELEETRRKMATGKGWASSWSNYDPGAGTSKKKAKGQGGKGKGFKASGYIMYLQERKRRLGDRDNLSVDELIRKYDADWQKLSEDERQAWKNRVKS